MRHRLEARSGSPGGYARCSAGARPVGWQCCQASPVERRMLIRAFILPRAYHHPNGARRPSPGSGCFDPTFRRHQLDGVPARIITTRINWLGDPTSHDVDHRGNDLARRAVLRLSLLAGLQTISPTQRGRWPSTGAGRRNSFLGMSPGRCCCPHHGGDAVSVIQPSRLPAVYVIPAAGRPRHAPFRHLRLPAAASDGLPVGGGGDLARHVPVPVHYRGGAAPLHPSSGDPLTMMKVPPGDAGRPTTFP